LNPTTFRSAGAVALVFLGALAAIVAPARAGAVPAATVPPAAHFLTATGTCKANDQCGEGEFCAKLFGRCGEAGKCEERPKDCIEHGGKVLIRVVCGCDDKTYDSVCVAAIAGVSVAHEGACAPK
jgi:hypothetical protein